MFIHFRCRRCKNALSVAMRQAGCPMICPMCRGEVVVPSASEMAPQAATAVAVVRPSPTVSDARGSSANIPVADARGSPKQPRHRVIRRTLVAGSIGLLVLVAAGWMTNRVWSKWWQPASQDVAFVDESLSEDADNSEDQPDIP